MGGARFYLHCFARGVSLRSLERGPNLKSRLLTLVLVIMAALALTPMTAFAAEGDWTYDAGEKTLTNGSGVVLTNVVASSTDLTIGQQTKTMASAA